MFRDTAGQEEYASLRPLAYNNCDVFLIIFSVIDQPSFYNAKVKVWIISIFLVVQIIIEMRTDSKQNLRRQQDRSPESDQPLAHHLRKSLQINNPVTASALCGMLSTDEKWPGWGFYDGYEICVGEEEDYLEED